MAKAKPTICVIILSWNRKGDTLETIGSLSKSDTSTATLSITVVDNGSTDGSQSAVKNLGLKNLKLISNKSNIGFAAGNNVGIIDALSRGFDYIALLNDDTSVDENLIKNIIHDHEIYPEAGAISPKIYFSSGFEYHKRYKKSELGKVIWYAGGDIDWDNVYGTNHGVDEVDHGQFDSVRETDFATGCFVVYKREVLIQLGAYNENYFAYMEDAEHAQRIKKAGWKVLYSPHGHMWHKVSQSSGIGSELNDYFLTRNRMIFGMSFASFRAKFALIRESMRFMIYGRKWQRIGIIDFYLGKYGKGSWGK